MKLNLGNKQMFFAYHIRSAFKTCELALKDLLEEKNLSPEHFYVLRCDWKPVETGFEDIKAHAMLTIEEANEAISDLVSKKYVVRGTKENHYSLSPEGAIVRNNILELYTAHIAKLTEGISENAIESGLSSLLKIQNNIHRNNKTCAN